MGRLYAELELWEIRDRLAEQHPALTPEMMVAVAHADPKLAQRVRAQRTFEGALRVAVRWYCDEGHPQPAAVLSWSPATREAFDAPPKRPDLAVPRWGVFRPLDNEDAADKEEYGPWPKAAAAEAAKLHLRDRWGRERVNKRTGIPERQVRIIFKLLARDPPALIWDEVNGLRPGPGWITRAGPDARTFVLTRL